MTAQTILAALDVAASRSLPMEREAAKLRAEIATASPRELPKVLARVSALIGGARK